MEPKKQEKIRKRTKNRAKDVYQTYTVRKPPSACTPVTLSSPATMQWSGLLLHVACSLRRTRYNALSMAMTQQFSQFCPWLPCPLTFDFDIQTRPIEEPNTSSL